MDDQDQGQEMKYLPWNTTEEDLVWAFGYGLTIEVEIGG
jgi:hypothetical protein